MPGPFIQDRDSSRKVFLDTWDKYNRKLPLEPLEETILTVILAHPEYHRFLADECVLEKDFLPDGGEVNPFLHMGLHISILEQVASDRPAGITGIYNRLVQKHSSNHDAEHIIMDCLAETLWWGQRHNTLPDESMYLECLERNL